ncbi:helix-turn-helix domain-containing protein [Actinomadura monticuli]|uniref:NB-ARC domain-containing protein n=1 Tax=Actinomadura monticuli TaxID=3097367 RepID=A0ABV4Q5E0_9ACTN
MARWAELRGDHVEPRELAQFLRNVVDDYRLSVRQLEDRMPYSRSVISERLSGKARPGWEFVEALIDACARTDMEARALLKADARERWKAADPTRLTPVDGEAAEVLGPVDLIVERIVERLQEPSAGVTGTEPRPPRRGAGPLAPRPFEGPVPERNRHFTERAGMLERLTAGFSACRVQVLHGLLGTGKTQLAAEYARRPASGYELVVWVPAGEPSHASSSMAALAPRLGLEFTAPLPIMEAARAVLAALRDGAIGDRWLLVFDNAGHVTDDLLRLVPRGGGHVLITSRDPAWASVGEVGGAIEVGSFSRAESVDFVGRRVGPGPDRRRHDPADADRLAEALGDLPLGLEQAATLLDRFPRLSIAECLAWLSREPGRALDLAAPTAYPVTLKIAWSLAENKLGTRSPEALALLRHCARSPLDPVPLRTSGLDGPDSPDAQDGPGADAEFTALLADRFGAVEELRRSGLAHVAADGIRVHRLARALVLEEPSGPAAGT